MLMAEHFSGHLTWGVHLFSLPDQLGFAVGSTSVLLEHLPVSAVFLGTSLGTDSFRCYKKTSASVYTLKGKLVKSLSKNQ